MTVIENVTGRDVAGSAVFRTDAGERPGSASQPLQPLRVLVVADDAAGMPDLRNAVIKLGLVTVGQASGPEACVASVLREKPDVVLLAVPFVGGDALDILLQMQGEWPCPVVVMGERLQPSLMERALDVGLSGHTNRPVTTDALLASIGLAVRAFDERQRLRKECLRLQQENIQLAQTLENRKVIERAKGVFMRRLNLDEAEAHRRMQQESQKRRLALAELAKKILESEELFGFV